MKTLVVLGILAASTASAGEVTIGISWLDGSPKAGTCHKTTFRGPFDLMARYEKAQKSKLEPTDPGEMERLKGTVDVVAEVNTFGAIGQECARTAEAPKRIIFLQKGSDTPLLSIPLEPKQTEMANLQGAKFTVWEARGTVGAEEIRKMTGKEYEFRLIYESHGFIDKWKKEYSEKVLSR